MSKFLPKDYDAATREFYSSVGKRTRSKRKIYFGVAQGSSCSSGDVVEISTVQGNSATRCHRRTKKMTSGNGNEEDMNSMDIEIEKIDKAELRNKKMHSAFKEGSSIRPEPRGDSAANFTNPSRVSKNVPQVDMHEENFDMNYLSSRHLKESLLAEKGNKNGDISSEEIEIERIDEAEFRRKEPLSPSMRSFSTWQGHNEGDSTAYSSENARGNGNEDMNSMEIEIEKIDKAEFRNKKMHSASIKQESRGDSAANFANPSCVSKNVPQVDMHESSFSRDAGDTSMHEENFDVENSFSSRRVKESLLAEKGNKNEDTSSEEIEIERIDEAEFRRKEELSASSMRSFSTWQGNNEGDSVACCSENARGNKNEDTSSEEIEIERIDEAEFRRKEELSSSMRSFSTWQGNNEGDSVAYCSENARECENQSECKEIDENKNKRTGSVQRITGSGSDSEKTISQYDNEVASSQKDEISSQGSGHLIASQARLKKEILKKQSKVDRTILGSSDQLLSPSDSGFESVNYEYNSGEISDSFDAVESSRSMEHNLQDKTTEDLCNEKGSVAKYTSKKRDVSNCDDENLLVDDEMNDKEEETMQPAKKKLVTSKKHYDFIRILSDSVLNKGSYFDKEESDEEAKQETSPQYTLPSKFRFEDEVPKPAEQSEFDKMVEGLFAEAALALTLEEIGSLHCHENDINIARAPDSEETQHDRCSRGEHCLDLRDDIGVRCRYCPYVDCEAEEVMPPWVEKTYRESDRKRCSDKEQLYMPDGLDLESSVDNVTGFISKAEGSVWNFSPCLREGLYKHQQEGFEFLWKNLAGSIDLTELRTSDPSGVGGCIISHAPGTGKTRLAIVFLETYLKLFPNCRPMIIAPASMLLTWEEEFRKWEVNFPFHNLGSVEFSGKENKLALKHLPKRKCHDKDAARWVKLYSWDRRPSVLGISYTLYEKLAGEEIVKGKGMKKRKRSIVDEENDPLKKILLEKPGLVILDEGHTPRNDRSSIWNTLLKLKTEKCVILSGTPFQNNFAELFNTLRLVRPAIADTVGREREFAEMITSRGTKMRGKYKGPRSSSVGDPFDNASIEKLKSAIAPFVHIHKGAILQQSLPGLRDCVILLRPPALQKSLLVRIEGLPNTFEFEHKVALISVHPFLFLRSHSTEKEKVEIDQDALESSRLNPNEGVKTRFLMELVRLSIANNEKVLVFSQYIQPLELIKDQLMAIFDWVDGKQVFTMQGKLEQKQRQIWINLFNDPQSEVKVMLASTKCCSEGINLIGASRIVLLDVVWNPSVERQAISRAYRLGQKKVVYTYHLMTSGTTEGDKYCRQAQKDRLSELVFSSSSNENENKKKTAAGIEDTILEEMVHHAKLKDMFEKIINQPKDTNLIETFGLTS